MKSTRQFGREFEIDAVKRVKERDVSLAQAARDLDVHEDVLRKWARELTADPQQAFPGHGTTKPELAESELMAFAVLGATCWL